MLGAVIRTIGRLAYTFPHVPQDTPVYGPYGQLKIALVADYFTSICLSAECCIRNMTPANYYDVLTNWKPDIVFVESAFHGVRGEWRYRLARQPWYFRFGPDRAMPKIVRLARDRGIPTIFWNKDDGAFFEPFIDVAKLFEYVFTTDNTCVPRYQAVVPADSKVNVLSIPYQPAFHNFTGFHFKANDACFVGSYYRKILDTRRQFLDMIFDAACEAATPVNIYDRNSNRLSRYFEFSYPKRFPLKMHKAVPYTETANIYKDNLISLNVNSVTTSETMYSRRLLEILACGGILVTNPSPVVEHEFPDFCHIVRSKAEAVALFKRLNRGPSQEDLDRAEAGANYVRQKHTWAKRLQQIAEIVKF